MDGVGKKCMHKMKHLKENEILGSRFMHVNIFASRTTKHNINVQVGGGKLFGQL